MNVYEILCDSLYYALLFDTPVLSGNMNDHIEIISQDDKETVICISAPRYDIEEWKKTGKIKYTGELPDYALSVNLYGGFHSGNASKHWVNRDIFEVCSNVPDAEIDWRI